MMKHAIMFVQHCFKLHRKWLLDQHLELTQHWIWSDGIASQFKAKQPFYFVGKYPCEMRLDMI